MNESGLIWLGVVALAIIYVAGRAPSNNQAVVTRQASQANQPMADATSIAGAAAAALSAAASLFGKQSPTAPTPDNSQYANLPVGNFDSSGNFSLTDAAANFNLGLT